MLNAPATGRICVALKSFTTTKMIDSGSIPVRVASELKLVGAGSEMSLDSVGLGSAMALKLPSLQL